MTLRSEDERPNPEPCDGSLIWWARLPTREQNYLQAVLEGYDDLGYCQTFDSRVRTGEGGEPASLARFTSSVDAEAEMRALLEAFAREIGLEMPDSAPSFGHSEQPKPSQASG